MTYVGIDPSLTSTAIAIVNDQIVTAALRTSGHRNDSLAQRIGRLNQIETWVRDHLRDLGTGLMIGIEGPAYSRQAQTGVHLRAGLWWRLVTRASRYGQVIEVSPTTLKRYATGKGNADKDHVLIAVAKRYPAFRGSSNDEADALVLAAMMARLDGHPLEEALPQSHLRGLDTLQGLA